MKISIEENKVITLMQIFYSDYFERYLQEMIDGNPEKSVVTLFKGIEFFLKLQKELNIKDSYTTIEEFLIGEYEDGENIYNNLLQAYKEEIKIYNNSSSTFEELFGEGKFY